LLLARPAKGLALDADVEDVVRDDGDWEVMGHVATVAALEICPEGVRGWDTAS
jgi:hypothetical protein